LNWSYFWHHQFPLACAVLAVITAWAILRFLLPAFLSEPRWRPARPYEYWAFGVFVLFGIGFILQSTGSFPFPRHITFHTTGGVARPTIKLVRHHGTSEFRQADWPNDYVKIPRWGIERVELADARYQPRSWSAQDLPRDAEIQAVAKPLIDPKMEKVVRDVINFLAKDAEKE
jgi:hypothetical protein